MKAPWARRPAASAALKRLNDMHSFYVAPHGANDDWYWMYAAVQAGARALPWGLDLARARALAKRWRHSLQRLKYAERLGYRDPGVDHKRPSADGQWRVTWSFGCCHLLGKGPEPRRAKGVD